MRSVWYDPELNVKEAIEKQEYGRLIEYAQENSNLIQTAWNDGDHTLLVKRLNKGSIVIQRLTSWIKHQNHFIQAVFELGSLKGTISGLKQAHYIVSKEEDIAKEHQQRYRYIPHLEEIIDTLADHGSLSHSDLANTIKMKSSTLTEVMKRVLPEKLVNTSSLGKYKIYSLSDQGRHYAHFLKDRTISGYSLISISGHSSAVNRKQILLDSYNSNYIRGNWHGCSTPKLRVTTIQPINSDDPTYTEIRLKHRIENSINENKWNPEKYSTHAFN